MYSEILEYSKLAQKILSNEKSGYFRQKNLIKKNFFSKLDLTFSERTYLRLTIIDSFYSTNMQRRYYGFEDLTKAIIGEFNSEDEIIKSASECKNNILSNIYDFRLKKVFDKSYGINKFGDSKKKAYSLITKYLYFLTEFDFPIYDSLVIESYPKIFQRFNLEGIVNAKGIMEPSLTIKNLLSLNVCINNLDKLDNLLWLVGKINRGNFSLILEKKSFIQLINSVFPNKPKLTSKQKDEEIKKYVFQNVDNLENIFNKDIQKFIKFLKTI